MNGGTVWQQLDMQSGFANEECVFRNSSSISDGLQSPSGPRDVVCPYLNRTAASKQCIIKKEEKHKTKERTS